MKLSIVIPVFNEERTISAVVDSVRNAVSMNENIDWEILVVDDGSSDSTSARVYDVSDFRIKLIKHSRNMGKGSAIITGIHAATGDCLIIKDADMEQSADDINPILAAFLENDMKVVVYGSRFMNSKIHLTRMSYYGNKLFNIVVRILYNVKLTDMWTGYKIARLDDWIALDLSAKRFDIEAEITAKFIRHDNKILEVPISFDPRSYEDGKHIRYRDGIAAMKMLLKIRFTKLF